MASAISLGSRPGTIQVAGDPTGLEVSASAGPVILTPGSGTVARRAGRALIMDALLAEPAETFDIFRPGAVAAATVGTWRNTFRQQTAYLRKLELNLGTAQTVGDPANCWRVKVADALGLTALLPMVTNGARSYVLDQGLGTNLAAGENSPTDAATGFSVALPTGYGACFGFIPTQALTLTGIRTAANAAGFWCFDSSVAVKVRGSILDVNGVVVAQGYSVTPAVVGSQVKCALAFSFPAAVTLNAGAQYFLAIDAFENFPSGLISGHKAYFQLFVPSVFSRRNGADPIHYQDGTGTGAYAGAPGFIAWAGNPDNPSIAAVNALTWQHIFSGTAALPGGTIQAAPIGTSDYSWRLLGSPAGLPAMTGDLTFSIEAVGAPLAGAAGSDLNLRAVLGTS